MRQLRSCLAAGLVVLTGTAAPAHYHVFLPANSTPREEQPISVTLAWGHPFEHQMFDAAPPTRVTVTAPDGAATDLTSLLTPTAVGGKRTFTASFTPTRRGDHVFVAEAAPMWMAEEGLYFHDRVKVVVHGATQVGWDRAVGGPLDLVPLTRPYGLEPHVAFQAQALADGKPAAGLMVELERYNQIAPSEASMPPDEQVTRRVKTDPNGVLTCSLHDPGWWAVTAIADGGTRDHDGKPRPVRRRATLWVHVDAKAAGPK